MAIAFYEIQNFSKYYCLSHYPMHHMIEILISAKFGVNLRLILQFKELWLYFLWKFVTFVKKKKQRSRPILFIFDVGLILVIVIKYNVIKYTCTLRALRLVFLTREEYQENRSLDMGYKHVISLKQKLYGICKYYIWKNQDFYL